MLVSNLGARSLSGATASLRREFEATPGAGFMQEDSDQLGWYAQWKRRVRHYRTAPLSGWEHSLIHDLMLHCKWMGVSLSVIFAIALYAVWGHVPALWIWLFVAAFMIEAVVKVTLAERYTRLPQQRQYDPIWRLIFDVGSMYAAVAYGLAFLVMFHPMPADNRYLLIAAFCTLICGASVTSAYFLTLSRSTFIALVAPTTIALLLSGRSVFILLALLLPLTVVIALCLGAVSQRRFRLLFDLNERNKSLVHDLSQQRTRAEHHQSVAEQAVVDKSRFVAMASHDLRQPLHALGLFHHALRVKSEEPSNRSLFDSVDQSTAALNAMFDSLLDVSKLDANVVDPVLEPVNIHSVFDLLEQEFAPIASSKHLYFSCEPVDVFLFTDRTLFTRILRNLLSNAIKFTDAGGITMVAARCGKDLVVSINDTGSGIPIHEQNKVFAEFYQLGAEERRGAVGVGLGLSIVRRLGDLLDVKVSLVSEAGGGTCVSLRAAAIEPQLDSALECSDQTYSKFSQFSSDTEQVSAVDTAGFARSAKSVEIDNSVDLHGLTVLFIDDESSIRQGMREMLVQWGWSAICVADDAEAMTQLASDLILPDVVVCDYQLAQGRSGVDVIDSLRQKYAYELPAILVSGASTPEELLKIENSGLQCLTKPVSPQALQQAIRKVVQPVLALNKEDFALI